jgi:hypothetical protein
VIIYYWKIKELRKWEGGVHGKILAYVLLTCTTKGMGRRE